MRAECNFREDGSEFAEAEIDANKLPGDYESEPDSTSVRPAEPAAKRRKVGPKMPKQKPRAPALLCFLRCS